MNDIERRISEWVDRVNERDATIAALTKERDEIEAIIDLDNSMSLVGKVADLKRAFGQVCGSYQDAANEMFKAQADLTRLRELVGAYVEAKVDWDAHRLQEDPHSKMRYKALDEAEQALIATQEAGKEGQGE